MLNTRNRQDGGGNGRHGAPLPTKNDLSAEVRSQMVELCNAILADTFDLHSHAKQAHWNVRGSHFMSLHKLFDDLAEVLEGYVDMIAERATALGGIAMGTARMAVKNTRLPEYPSDIFNGMDHVQMLSDRMAAVGREAREAIEVALDAGDQATGDLFIEMVRDLDKWLWFVEAHLRPA